MPETVEMSISTTTTPTANLEPPRPRIDSCILSFCIPLIGGDVQPHGRDVRPPSGQIERRPDQVVFCINAAARAFGRHADPNRQSQ